MTRPCMSSVSKHNEIYNQLGLKILKFVLEQSSVRNKLLLELGQTASKNIGFIWFWSSEKKFRNISSRSKWKKLAFVKWSRLPWLMILSKTLSRILIDCMKDGREDETEESLEKLNPYEGLPSHCAHYPSIVREERLLRLAPKGTGAQEPRESETRRFQSHAEVFLGYLRLNSTWQTVTVGFYNGLRLFYYYFTWNDHLLMPLERCYQKSSDKNAIRLGFYEMKSDQIRVK